MRRLFQIIKYGAKHSKEISLATNKSRIGLFLDIVYCYFKYKMWSNEYKKEHFYELSESDRAALGNKYREFGTARDRWQKQFVNNRKFIAKYSNIKYEIGAKRTIRNKAYAAEFAAGSNLFVEYGVDISRQHYLCGEIKIGKNARLCKRAILDYSGGLSIGDNVTISEDTLVLSHKHNTSQLLENNGNSAVPAPTVIGNNVWIGAKCTILGGVTIGDYAVVGAGSIVTHDVPSKAVVVNEYAKQIKTLE